MTFLSQIEACVAIDPDGPPSRDKACRYHDRLKGPKDSYGRRLWTPEICAAIRKEIRANRKARTT